MHDLAFRREHRFELVRLAVAQHALGGRQRELFELIGATRAIALGIDRVVAAVVTHAGVDDVVEDQVERFERVAVAADQHRKIGAGHFEILALFARNVTDVDVVHAHVR